MASQDLNRIVKRMTITRGVQWVALALMTFVLVACGAADVSEEPVGPIAETPTRGHDTSSRLGLSR